MSRRHHITLDELASAICWRRYFQRGEAPPPAPYYARGGIQPYFIVLPIRVPGIRAMRQPPLQQVPRSRR